MTDTDPDDISTSPRRRVRSHRFLPEQWRFIRSREEIIEYLRRYKEEYAERLEDGWRREDIEHFLELYHFMYPDRFPTEDHIRTIYTILQEVNLDDE